MGYLLDVAALLVGSYLSSIYFFQKTILQKKLDELKCPDVLAKIKYSVFGRWFLIFSLVYVLFSFGVVGVFYMAIAGLTGANPLHYKVRWILLLYFMLPTGPLLKELLSDEKVESFTKYFGRIIVSVRGVLLAPLISRILEEEAIETKIQEALKETGRDAASEREFADALLRQHSIEKVRTVYRLFRTIYKDSPDPKSEPFRLVLTMIGMLGKDGAREFVSAACKELRAKVSCLDCRNWLKHETSDRGVCKIKVPMENIFVESERFSKDECISLDEKRVWVKCLQDRKRYCNDFAPLTVLEDVPVQ
ncbi:MAG: hypothetical protein AB1512_02970 [Thermodesulfobacteriota bacterium]